MSTYLSNDDDDDESNDDILIPDSDVNFLLYVVSEG